MNATETRRNAILTQLERDKSVRVEYLAEILGTSQVTIRKDLAVLETRGLLIRRFGGAIPVSVVADTGSGSTSPTPVPVRKAIARAAASLITPNSRLVIDSGRTTNALLPFIADTPGLVIMTNSLVTALAVSELPAEPTLLMPGGTWDRQSESFQGRLAEQMINEYDFDWLFVGADGLDINKGTTTFNELVGLSRAMSRAAQKTVVMAESAKVGRRMHNIELPWQNIQYFITDSNLDDEHNKAIAAQGVEVICVEVNED